MRTGILLTSTLLWASCASVPPPTAELAQSERTIQTAAAEGAQKVPAATLYLQYAEAEVGRAKELIAAKKNERAASLLVRAQADADMAFALARDAAIQNETQRVREEIQALQTQGREFAR
jgi:hypothetical protein